MMPAVWCLALLLLLLAQPAASHSVIDLSGSGNNGTAHGCTSTPDGLMLNGTLDSYVLVSDAPSLDLGGSSNGSLMYRISIVNDIHVGQRDSIGNHTLREFVSNVYLRPDIVLTAGDCFEHSVDDAGHFLDIMANLSCPWVYVWGDHEWGGVPPYDGRNETTTQAIKSRLQSRGVNADLRKYTYLDVDKDGKVDFMLVVLPPVISEDDLTWFDALPSDKPIIVVHHVPAAMDGWRSYDASTPHANMLLRNAETVRQHFESKGVLMVISGHDHGYAGATEVNGTWYLSSRRAGSTWGVDAGYSIIDLYTNGSIEFYTRWFDEDAMLNATGGNPKDNHAVVRTPEAGFTVEVVCTPTHLSTYSYLLDKGVAGNRNYGMCIKGTGAVYAVSHDTVGEIWAESSAGVVHAGELVHAIMVANSTCVKLYVNGKMVAQKPAHPPYTTNECPL